MKPINALMLFAIVAVAFAVGNLFVSMDAYQTVVGYALQDQGSAQLEVEAAASIEFSVDTLNWGTGHVDTSSATYASLRTVAPILNDWVEGTPGNSVTGGLVLVNIGNADVSVELSSSNDADGFIGGTHDQLYQWQIANNEAGSCTGTLADTTWADVTVTPSTRVICDNLADIPDTADSLLIDIWVNVPDDAVAGAKSSTITATATAV